MDNKTREFAQKIISELEKIAHALTNTPRQQNTAGVCPQDAAEQQHAAASGQVAFPLKIQPSPHNTAKSQQRWYKTINGWKSLLEVIAIPFGIGYAVITYYQWKDLRHHFELDERAWLNIRHDSPFKEGSHAPPDLVSGLVDKVQLVNVGKTAARNLRLLCKAEVLSSSTAPSFDYTKNGSSATRGLLFQGDTITLEFGSANEISKEQGVSLLAGESYIAFYGVVAYDDIFGKPHETRICWWRHFHANMTASARSCTDYNYTDGN